jgi:hypothetical protein
VDARILSISEKRDVIRVLVRGERLLLRVPTTELQEELRGFFPGDLVRLQVAVANTGAVLQTLRVREHEASGGARLGMLLGSAALLFFVAVVLLRTKPSHLVRGFDNRFSTSKAQTVLWFGIVLVTYVALLWRRISAGGLAFCGGINIPDNLLLLSGLSAFTFVAAKAITTAKERAAASAPAGSPAAPAKTIAPAPKFHDLFTDDQGRVDVADFQILLITLLAAVVYLVQVFEFMSVVELHQKVRLPDVDKTILAFFGLGQGAYLTKKVAGDSA